MEAQTLLKSGIPGIAVLRVLQLEQGHAPPLFAENMPLTLTRNHARHIGYFRVFFTNFVGKSGQDKKPNVVHDDTGFSVLSAVRKVIYSTHRGVSCSKCVVFIV